jgi:hypothetical protein
MPGDAGAHLAPHDRHPELIADQGAYRRPGVSRPDVRSLRVRSLRVRSLRVRSLRVRSLRVRSLRVRSSLGLSPGHGRGNRPRRPGTPSRLARGFWPRIAAAGAAGAAGAAARRLGPPVLPQLREPVVHLEHAGVVWPDLHLHVRPPVEPAVSAVQLRATCFGTGIRSGKTDRQRLRVLDAPGLSTANATSTVMRAGIRPTRVRGYRQPAFGVPRSAYATIACPPQTSVRSHRSWF